MNNEVQPIIERKLSRLAAISFMFAVPMLAVCAILMPMYADRDTTILFLCMSPVPALVFGIPALILIARSGGRLRGANYAIAGIAIPLLVFWAVLPLPKFNWQDRARQSSCASNLKQLAIGMLMYSQEWDGHLPPAKGWNDAVFPYIKSKALYVCPEAENHQIPSYAMNAPLSGRRVDDLTSPKDTVMVFESRSGDDRVGGTELLPNSPRHSGGENLAFSDGHVKWKIEDDVVKFLRIRVDVTPEKAAVHTKITHTPFKHKYRAPRK